MYLERLQTMQESIASISPQARDRVINTVKDFKIAHEALRHIAFEGVSRF